MCNENNIPPRKHLCKRKGGNVRTGLYARLRALEIGESLTIPMKTRVSIHQYARDVGIKVATRQLDSEDTVTVWRVA